MKKDVHRIQTREAREALRRLLVELDRADLSGLKERVGAKEEVDNWVERLRRAERGFDEWCPNPEPGPNQFTIDVPPKTR